MGRVEHPPPRASPLSPPQMGSKARGPWILTLQRKRSLHSGGSSTPSHPWVDPPPSWGWGSEPPATQGGPPTSELLESLSVSPG